MCIRDRYIYTAQKSTSHYAPQPYTNQSVFKSLLNSWTNWSWPWHFDQQFSRLLRLNLKRRLCCIIHCVQGSASECVLVSMLAARHAALDELKIQYPNVEDGVLLARMVAYCSKLVRECSSRRTAQSRWKDERLLAVIAACSISIPPVKTLVQERATSYFSWFWENLCIIS